MTSSTERPAHAWHVGILGTVVLALGVCAPMFYDLGRWPLMDPDEGRNAEVAREMLSLGSWVVPRFNDLPFLDKPPMLFWGIAAAFRVFGLNEFAARLPSALAAVAVVLLAAWIGRMLLGRRAGFLVGAIVATSPLVLAYARLTIFDMPFTALVTLALACLLRRRLGGAAETWLPLTGLVMGLAMLTKGPVGVALPIVAWLAARGALPPAKPAGRRPVIAACLVFCAVFLPWLVLVARAEPAFLRYAIVDETFLRFTSTTRFHRGEPFYYPLLMALGGMGVWTAVLIGTMPLVARGIGTTERQRMAVKFAARAAVAIVVFFSISASKRPGYVLPAMAPLAVLVTVGLTAATERAATAVRVTALGALVVGLLFVAVAFDPGALAGIAPGEVSKAVTHPLLVTAAIVSLGWGALTFGAGRRWPLATIVLAAVLGPAVCLSIQGPLQPYAEGRSGRQLAIETALPPNSTLVSFRHFRPSLPFYLRRSVMLATLDGRELTSNYVASQHQRFLDGGQLMTPASARRMIREESPVYVLTGASWSAKSPRFRPTPLTLIATDDRTALWLARD